MRPVLVRLLLDDPWSWFTTTLEPLSLGIAWLWLLYGVVTTALLWRAGDTERLKDVTGWVLWIVVGAALTFVVPPMAERVFATRGGEQLGWGQPHLPVFGYGAFILAGFLAGVAFARRRLASLGYDADLAMGLGAWLLVAGVTGARLFYVVQYSDRVFAGVTSVPEYLLRLVNLPDGGLVLFGGLIFGAAAYFAFCYRSGVPPLRMADAVTPSVLLGIGFGRLGCLMYSCCYGDACGLPWAITFPEDSIAYAAMADRGIIAAGQTPSLHPTQIYSSVSAFLLAAMTAAYFSRRTADGAVFALGLMSYAVARFTVEILRGDELGQFGTRLTISQWIAVGLFTVGVAVAAYVGRKERVPATTLAT